MTGNDSNKLQWLPHISGKKTWVPSKSYSWMAMKLLWATASAAIRSSMTSHLILLRNRQVGTVNFILYHFLRITDHHFITDSSHIFSMYWLIATQHMNSPISPLCMKNSPDRFWVQLSTDTTLASLPMVKLAAENLTRKKLLLVNQDKSLVDVYN